MPRNKKLLGITILVAIVLIGLIIIFTKKGVVPQPTPTPKPAFSPTPWNNLIPGKSTINEIEEVLGKPLSVSGDIYEFKSSSVARNHQVKTENNIGVFYKEIVSVFDKKTSEEITKIYGDPRFVLYGPDAPNGTYLFIYPENGIAYLGNPSDKTLLEIWYFPPSTMEEFKKTWASGYSEEFKARF